MVEEFLHQFVTNPDLDKGFQWSGKTQSHIQLEEVNTRARRRLAGTFVGLEKACGLGGLLNNEYVYENVLDRIHDLGQHADELCNECAVAKRGSADLTKRTEKLEHTVRLLNNWVEWLRHPTIPGADGKPIAMPAATDRDAPNMVAATRSEIDAQEGLRKPWPAPPESSAVEVQARAERIAQRRRDTEAARQKARQAAAEKQAAADRAMAALLEGVCLAACLMDCPP
jgi:hypothetical protein